jgi:hypothetical protein
MAISSHPHLNVISGELWQLLVESWRQLLGGVLKSSCTLNPTTFSIPQTVRVEKPIVVGWTYKETKFM